MIIVIGKQVFKCHRFIMGPPSVWMWEEEKNWLIFEGILDLSLLFKNIYHTINIYYLNLLKSNFGFASSWKDE